jgi:hypothetical protein
MLEGKTKWSEKRRPKSFPAFKWLRTLQDETTRLCMACLLLPRCSHGFIALYRGYYTCLTALPKQKIPRILIPMKPLSLLSSHRQPMSSLSNAIGKLAHCAAALQRDQRTRKGYLIPMENVYRSPLWSSGQSCCLQIQWSGLDSRRSHIS